MTKLVIFDLDGTLLDTVEDLGNATNYALRMCCFPERPLKDYYQLVGRGIYNLFRSAMQAPDSGKVTLPDGGNETVSVEVSAAVPVPNEAMVQKMASYFLPYYGEHMCDFTRPYPGIPEMLASLAAAGIQVALASNKYQEGAEKLIHRFFPEIPFLKVLGQREGQPIKPDPQVVFQIMAGAQEVGPQSLPTDKQPFDPVLGPQSLHSGRQTFAPEDVAYVGDSNVDMQTGLNAGVRTIGVTWGFRDRAELEAFQPFAVVDTVQELQDLLMG
ncbi:MAG: HAD family hydrolase [Bacteroidales bacterium]|nr:HAD family hydrolase [Bacteroidales bacterium]